MSSPTNGLDRELLGEDSNNGGEATMAKANGGSDHGAWEGSHGAEFNPINATAGTLIKVSGNGDELDSGDDTISGDTKAVPKTSKKRGAATVANDESSQPAKKRPSPKKKAVDNINVKLENGDTDGETDGLEPVTPKKGKRAPAKAKAAKANVDVNANDGSSESNEKSASPSKKSGVVQGMTVSNTPRKRQAPKKEVTVPRGIPTSWDEADPADRMLVSMKEKGEGWSEIRAVWKTMTGQDTASSTLPNRYNRLKVNLMHMKEGDEQHLLAAKKEIEDAYNTNFWGNVAATMERRGADKYPAAFIQKTFKELEAAGKANLDADNGAASSSASAAAGAVASGTKETEGVKGSDGVKEEDVEVKEEDKGDGNDA